MHPPRWSLAIAPLVAVASGQTCYWPNGGVASPVVACPVAGGTDAASCCFQNHYCMSNGLCFSKTELSFYRGACTDKDWSTSGCPKYCDKDDIEGGVLGAHAGIALCGDKKYACQTSSNCANDSFSVPAGVMLLNQYLQSDLGIVETATATATGTATTTATSSSTSEATGGASEATCSSTAAAAASSGISTGAAAGIGVGVGVPLALAVVLLTVLLLREKKKTRAALSTTAHGGNASTSPWAKTEQAAYAPVEIQTQTSPPELPSNQHGRHELS